MSKVSSYLKHYLKLKIFCIRIVFQKILKIENHLEFITYVWRDSINIEFEAIIILPLQQITKKKKR